MKIKGKILFVISPVGITTGYIRGLIFRDLLKLNQWNADFVSLVKFNYSAELDALRKTEDEILDMSPSYDIVYLLKVNSYPFIKKLRKRTKAKIIFDLTDALWKPNFRRNWFYAEEIVESADAVFSENEFVCEYGRRFNSQVYSIPACTQTEKFTEARKNLKPRTDDKIILGWIGSDSTITGIFSIITPLENLCAKYPNVELRIVGCDSEEMKSRLKNVRYTAKEKYTEEDMIREALSMDIGLFPVPSTIEDYRIRGALKSLVYMSAAVPPVCFNAGDPAKVIKDGVNGMLVSSSDEWEPKIEKLILDAALRKKMGQQGFETVKEKHSLESVFAEMEKAFIHVLKTEKKEKRTRTLNESLSRIGLKISVFLIVCTELYKAAIKKIFRY